MDQCKRQERRGSIEPPRIIRGFVFKSVFGDNPEMCLKLLEVTLDKKIARVECVQPEREFEPVEWARGGRVDLYVVDSEGNRYDVEVQAVPHDDEWKRARHYQALMDATQLRKGARAADLRDSIVIFICDFDPLGADYRRYDCRTTCDQTGDTIQDGRLLVMLNTKGTKGSVSSSLDAFLRFASGEQVEDDAFVDEIRATISRYMGDAEWMEHYMTLEEEMEAIRLYAAREASELGRRQGLAEGREQGMAEGREQGLAEGREQGMAEGREQGMQEGREQGMQEGREQGMQEGREQGMQEGYKKAGLDLAVKLVRSGAMDFEQAVALAGIDDEELKEALDT